MHLLRSSFYSFCNFEELDLSGMRERAGIADFSSLSFAEVTLTSVDLPDPSHLQYLKFAAANAGCYDTLLAGAANLKRALL